MAIGGNGFAIYFRLVLHNRSIMTYVKITAPEDPLEMKPYSLYLIIQESHGLEPRFTMRTSLSFQAISGRGLP